MLQVRMRDLGLADLVKGEPASPQMEYQDALILAMRQEQAAFNLYVALAGVTTDAPLRAVLESLAQEEAQHRARFESEYEQVYLQEN